MHLCTALAGTLGVPPTTTVQVAATGCAPGRSKAT